MGVTLTALLTVILPLAAKHSTAAFVMIRVLQGMTEASLHNLLQEIYLWIDNYFIYFIVGTIWLNIVYFQSYCHGYNKFYLVCNLIPSYFCVLLKWFLHVLSGRDVSFAQCADDSLGAGSVQSQLHVLYAGRYVSWKQYIHCIGIHTIVNCFNCINRYCFCYTHSYYIEHILEKYVYI